MASRKKTKSDSTSKTISRKSHDSEPTPVFDPQTPSMESESPLLLGVPFCSLELTEDHPISMKELVQVMTVFQHNLSKITLHQLQETVDNRISLLLQNSFEEQDGKLNDLGKNINHISQQFDDMKSELEEIKKSQVFLEKTYEEHKEVVLATKNLAYTNQNKVADLKNNITDLQDEMKSLKLQNDQLDQYSRRDSLEVHGVPVKQHEDTDAIIQDIAQKVNVKIDVKDISVSHRLPKPFPHDAKGTSPYPPAILVKFASRNVRNLIFGNRRNLVKNQGTNSIYIRENLSSYNRQLFNKAKALKKEKNYKYLWTNQCRIYVRKNDDSRCLRIENESDLTKIQ